MIHVAIAAAYRVPGDTPVLAQADVVLDGCLTVAGVEVVEAGPSGRPIAVAPRRPYGARGRVLAWSPGVAHDLAHAILRALDGETRAVAGADAQRALARELLLEEAS